MRSASGVAQGRPDAAPSYRETVATFQVPDKLPFGALADSAEGRRRLFPGKTWERTPFTRVSPKAYRINGPHEVKLPHNPRVVIGEIWQAFELVNDLEQMSG